MRSSFSCLALLLLLCSVRAAPAQEATALFDETLDVRVVNVEVVVTLKDGHPVSNLERDDFEILVRGKPVPITNFFVMNRRNVRQDEDPEMQAASLDQLPRSGTRRLQMAILVDERHLSPVSRSTLLEGLRQSLLEQLQPGDRAMVARLRDGLEVVQGFTEDKTALESALQSIEVGSTTISDTDAEERLFQQQLRTARTPAKPQSGFGIDAANFESAVELGVGLGSELRTLAERRYQSVLRSLQSVDAFAASLAGVPGRKALIYVSDGLAQRPAEALSELYRSKYEDWALRNNVAAVRAEVLDLRSLRLDAADSLDKVARHANSAGVVFYPLTDMGGGGSLGRIGSGGLANRVSGSQLGDSMEAFSRLESLMALAADTGGFATSSSAAASRLLADVRRDFESFYSLGFSPRADWSGSFQGIEVRVKRKDVAVRHARGFAKKDVTERLNDLALAGLWHDVQHNPLGLKIEEQRQEPTGKDRYQVSFLVKIPMRNLLLVPREEAHAAQVDLVVMAADARGRASSGTQILLPIRVPNEQMLNALEASATYPLTLEMRAGEQTVSIAAQDRVAQVESLSTVPVIVGGAREQQ